MESLSLSHDGLGPAIANLDWCVLIQSECAQSAPQQHDGAGHKSTVRRARIFIFGVTDNRAAVLFISLNCYLTH